MARPSWPRSTRFVACFGAHHPRRGCRPAGVAAVAWRSTVSAGPNVAHQVRRQRTEGIIAPRVLDDLHAWIALARRFDFLGDGRRRHRPRDGRPFARPARAAADAAARAERTGRREFAATLSSVARGVAPSTCSSNRSSRRWLTCSARDVTRRSNLRRCEPAIAARTDRTARPAAGACRPVRRGWSPPWPRRAPAAAARRPRAASGAMPREPVPIGRSLPDSESGPPRPSPRGPRPAGCRRGPESTAAARRSTTVRSSGLRRQLAKALAVGALPTARRERKSAHNAKPNSAKTQRQPPAGCRRPDRRAARRRFRCQSK